MPAIRRATAIRAFVAGAIFIALLAAANAVVARLALPDYSSWTGIQPLEEKLRSLEAFAAQGDVDALVLGSSIADFGFSAELYSRLASDHEGRPFRAFNFATGGAEPRTLPKLYRLARTVSKPKAVFVLAPPEPILGEEPGSAGPDQVLMMSPAGAALPYPWILAMHKKLWEMPLLKRAPALRDLVLFHAFRNLQVSGMEAYRVTPNGDRVSYTFSFKSERMQQIKEGNERIFVSGKGAAVRTSLEHFFARIDIRAMDELRELVERDGGRIVLVTSAGSATWWGGPSNDAAYVKTRRKFFELFAERLHAPLWNVLDVPVTMPFSAIADFTHLNAYGAEMYTRLVFAASIGKLDQVAEEVVPALESARLETLSLADPTFDSQAAVIRRPAGAAHPLLRFRMVRSRAVLELPQRMDFYAGLRLPDGKDLIVPAHLVGPSDFVAAVDLPPAQHMQVLVLRLLSDSFGKPAIANPLADYEWLTSYPRGLAASASPMQALPLERLAGEAIYVALDAARLPGARYRVALFSAGARADDGGVELGTASMEHIARFQLPRHLAPGSYELRAFDAATGSAQVTSNRVDIMAAPRPTPRLWLTREPQVSDDSVEVAWAGLRYPQAHDWVGLFPVGTERRLELKFTGGAAEGRMRLRLPPAIVAGLEYELRLYAADSWRVLAKSGSLVLPEAPGSRAGSARASNSRGSGARLWISGMPSRRDEPVELSWTGIGRPTALDWIGLFPVGGNDDSRLDVQRTTGTADGRIAFTMPTHIRPGVKYEFRLYPGDSWEVMAQSEVLVLPAELFSPRAESTAAGDAQKAASGGAKIWISDRPRDGFVEVSWSGMEQASALDWIGLFPLGGGDDTRLDVRRTAGAKAGRLSFPLARTKPGVAYEFRLYAADTWKMTARSASMRLAEDAR